MWKASPGGDSNVSRPAVFYDTSYVVALENHKDLHHEKAKSLGQQLVDEDCLFVLHWGNLD